MATKNHFSNYENLFSAYRESLLNGKNNINAVIEKDKNELKNLENELREINIFLKNPKKSIHRIDTRKSQEFLPKLEKSKKELESLKTSLKTLSESARKSTETTLTSYQTKLTETKNEISTLTNAINDPATPSNNLSSLKGKRTKLNNLLKTIQANIEKYSQIIANDDENLAKIQAAQEKHNTLQEKYDAILLDEKKYSRDANKAINAIDEEMQSKKARQKEIILEKNKLTKEIAQLEKDAKAVPTSTTGSIESFKKFLTDNKFSTVHAEELYEFYKNPNTKLTISKNEFKLRKQHPKRDRFLKKFVIPTTITAGAVGTAFGAIATSNMIAGSNWLFITVTSSPVTTFISAALPGAAIGAVAAIATIKVKDWLTKLYYNSKYGNAEKVINKPDSVKIDELIEKIENTKDKILDLRKGNFFTKPFRAIARTAKNIVNRNRVHHLESITEKLVEKFNSLSENKEISVDTKLENITPIYNQLSKINNFYAKDIKKSKIFAMLNCKEKNKNHSHKETIENLDIYSKLNMYLEKIEKMENVKKSTKKKAHKEIKADLKKQNVVAERLLNGEEVIGLVSKRYLELVKASDRLNTPRSKTISSYIVANGDLKVSFADGKTTTYQVENAQNITKVESVNKGKTLLITYKDGEQASISSIQPKINLNIAGEFKILEKLSNETIFNYLVDKGYSEKTLNTLIESLKATKFNKNGKEKAKPTAFMKSKTYKENTEYLKIFEDVVAVIKNPNLVNNATL